MERLAGGKTAESVLSYFRGVQFPAKKDTLVHVARTNGAPNDVVGALGALPANEFASPEEVIAAYPRMDG